MADSLFTDTQFGLLLTSSVAALTGAGAFLRWGFNRIVGAIDRMGTKAEELVGSSTKLVMTVTEARADVSDLKDDVQLLRSELSKMLGFFTILIDNGILGRVEPPGPPGPPQRPSEQSERRRFNKAETPAEGAAVIRPKRGGNS